MIYDKPLTQRKRPGTDLGDTDIEQIEGTILPDISEDIAAIDSAIAESARAAKQPKQKKPPSSSCGCARCGPHRSCPDHPGCDGRG